MLVEVERTMLLVYLIKIPLCWPFTSLLLQPIVAVPSFLCADAFNKFLPFCTGFAAGCMIWMVIAEVLPDGFKVNCGISVTITHTEHSSTFNVRFKRLPLL